MSLSWQNNPDGTTTFFDPAQPLQPLVGASLAAAVPVTPQLAGAAVGGTVSLLGDLVKIAAPIAGAYFGGPVGAAIGGALGGSLGGSAMPGSGQVASMAALPSIGTVGTVGGAVVRAGAAGARAIIASARYYCAKYPGWCISIGGLGAVQGMVQNGQLPIHRRRRARGISASEFRGFRKVHKVLSGFCAPKMRIRRKR
jgi:hypothetical protein